MAQFIYKARDRQGNLVDGSIDGNDQFAVAKGLKQLGYTVITIKEKTEFKQAFEKFGFKRSKKISQETVVYFTKQLSTMLRSGVAITTALEGLLEQSRDKNFKIVIKTILDDIEKGKSFSESLKSFPLIFPETYSSMIRVAETAGNIDEVLERLSNAGIHEMEIRGKIRSAAIYPVVLVTVGLGVITFMVTFVLPKFAALFETSGTKLPLPTLILLKTSFIIRKLWLVIVAVIVGAAIWVRVHLSKTKGRYNFDRKLFKIPVFGDLYLKTLVASFVRTLGGMTKAGVPMLESLIVLEKTITNTFMRKIVQDIRTFISDGGNLTEAFKASGLFPPMVVQMISVGEKSGMLDQMFFEIASFYDNEVESSIKNMVTVLEPTLLLSMGLMVGFIALSVLMPIFNLIKVFRK